MSPDDGDRQRVVEGLRALRRLVDVSGRALVAGEVLADVAALVVAMDAASLAGAAGCPLHRVADAWAVAVDDRMRRLGRPGADHAG